MHEIDEHIVEMWMAVDSKNNLLALAPLMCVVKLSVSKVEQDLSLKVS